MSWHMIVDLWDVSLTKMSKLIIMLNMNFIKKMIKLNLLNTPNWETQLIIYSRERAIDINKFVGKTQ